MSCLLSINYNFIITKKISLSRKFFWEEWKLDKRKGRNYFWFGKSKKGGMKYGMGINNLETIWGAAPF